MPPQFENNVPPVNNPETKRPRGHKFLITLFGLFLISASFAWWYLYNLPPEPESETFATKTDEFADWQTYRNEELGFEIKLPIVWKKEDMGDEIWFTHPNLYRIFVKTHPPFEINFSPINARIDVEEVMLLEFEKIRSTFKLISTSSLIQNPTGNKVGYIKRVYLDSNKYFTDFDEIQFFKFEEVIKAKQEDGVCETNENFECFTPSGYYVRNKDQSTKKIQISNDVVIKVLSDCYNLFDNGITITIKEFIDNFGKNTACVSTGASKFHVPSDSPYWITSNDEGVIVKIIQQYIP